MSALRVNFGTAQTKRPLEGGLYAALIEAENLATPADLVTQPLGSIYAIRVRSVVSKACSMGEIERALLARHNKTIRSRTTSMARLQLPFLSLPVSVFIYAAKRSEGSEPDLAPNSKLRGSFLNEFILAYIAPGERFSFLAIGPTLTLDTTSSRS
jgi:hypothetical protein